MKANNLSISIPFEGCDMKGHCAHYCVSKMTGSLEAKPYLMYRNIPKVKKMAEIAGVTLVVVTILTRLLLMC